MVQYTTTIKRFDSQGEKTGWTYIDVLAAHANQMVPGTKKAFRVKGQIDHYVFEGISLVPMGGGDYILTLNATVRKGIGKTKGAIVQVKLEPDLKPVVVPVELLECLKDEPAALDQFNKLAPSHRRYFINWVDSAKTAPTKAKRIAASVHALIRGWDFGTMIRSLKNDREDLIAL